jgi:hypothetical protein
VNWRLSQSTNRFWNSVQFGSNSKPIFEFVSIRFYFETDLGLGDFVNTCSQISWTMTSSRLCEQSMLFTNFVNDNI